MGPNPQETADLVTFTDEILNVKPHFCARYAFKVVHGYTNIHVICLISVTVTFKNYHTSLQMDEAVNLFCYILGETAVNDVLYSKFRIRFSFLFRSFSVWECFSVDNHWWYQQHYHELHCVKSIRIWSYSGPHFRTFGLNTDQNNSKYGHFLRSATGSKICSFHFFIY